MKYYCLLLLFIYFSFCNILQTGTGFWIQELSSELTTQQVVNQQCFNSNYRGIGGCIMNKGASPTSIRCEIVHNVEDLNGITIRQGLIGQEGPVIYTFTEDEFFGFFTGEILRSTFFLLEDDDDIDENYFLNGEWYILITSDSCPNGALRGQFTADYNIASLLRGFNEVPPISSPDQGYALGYFNTEPSSNNLDIIIAHTLQNPTNATLNSGFATTIGDVILTYQSAESPIIHSMVLDEELEQDLYNSLLYFNIESNNFPRGEIRDQLHVIDAFPQINYAFRLDNNQLVPSSNNPIHSLGYALFSINCISGTIEYMITHNVTNPQLITLHNGNRGSDGPSLTVLNGIVSPVFGNYSLGAVEYLSLLSGSLYIEISQEQIDGDFPVIRGQISNEFTYYSYISGTQHLPIITTAGKGIGLFSLNNNELEYTIQINNINSITSIDIYSGIFGENGNIIESLSLNSNSNIYKGFISLSSNEIQQLDNGDLYILISSLQYPQGEIRGQISQSYAQCTFPPIITISEETIDYSPKSSSSIASYISIEIYIISILLIILI